MSNHASMSSRGTGAVARAMLGDSIITRLRAAELHVDTLPRDAALARDTARLIRNFRIGRVATGVLLILHGLAHVASGIVLTDPWRSWPFLDGTMASTLVVWLVGTLWVISMLGFVAGGLGILGVAAFRRHGRCLVQLAATASVLVLAILATPYALIGATIDVALFACLGLVGTRSLRGRWVWHPTLLETTSAPQPQR